MIVWPVSAPVSGLRRASVALGSYQVERPQAAVGDAGVAVADGEVAVVDGHHQNPASITFSVMASIRKPPWPG